MKIRKKVLSVLCAAMLLGTITSVTVPQVQASDEQTKKVDGSYLTMQESASGTSQNEDAKGQYIMLGECSITKTVNLVSTIVYVDQYNEKDDAWDQIIGWSKDVENDYFVSTSKYITVEPGYYYRVRADHFAGMEYPYEEDYSFTDGIMIK